MASTARFTVTPPAGDGAAKPRTPWPLVLAVGFVVLALVALGLLNLLRPKPAAAQVGREVTAQGVTLLVESLECSTDALPARAAGGQSLSPAGQFCVATMRLHDDAADHRLEAARQRLRTSDAKEYPGAAEANGPEHAGSADVAVRRGQESRVQVVFDVPTDVHPVHLMLDLDGKIVAVVTP